jgi:hypothetical protein
MTTLESERMLQPPIMRADAAIPSQIMPGKVTYTYVTPPLRRASAKRKDGRPVTLLMRDWGDLRVAYDREGNPVEAYQTEWWIAGANSFVIVDKVFAEQSGNASQMRLVEDSAHLDAMGIDANSIDFLD